MGRALREAFDPVTLNFWRWVIAVAGARALRAARAARAGRALRRHAGILLLLAFIGVAVFQSLVYLGLRTTTTVNAVLLNSSMPLFMLLCSWLIERERATPRQVAGMLVSLAGILIILSRGELANLLALEFACRGRVDPARDADLGRLLGAAQAPAAGAERHRRSCSCFASPAWCCCCRFARPSSRRRTGRTPAAASAASLYMGIAPRCSPSSAGTAASPWSARTPPASRCTCCPRSAPCSRSCSSARRFAGFHAAGIATILAGVVLATRK